jgi:hypothetical protein
MRIALVLTYLAAIVAANLIITEAGPTYSVYTAFGLVALDLVLRDAIHDRFGGRGRIAVMAVLVVAGSVVSYIINAKAQQIALASSVAFAAALTVDAIVYHLARKQTWAERSNISNIAGSAVDSAVFVAVAFPGFLWSVAFGQFTAKVAGGVIFVLLLERVMPVGYYLFRERKVGDEWRHDDNDATLGYAITK